MAVLRIILFLLVVALPVASYAQGVNVGTGTTNASAINTQFGNTFQGVENVSESGGFIGSGRPTGFVGVDEFHNNSRANNRRTTTPARQVSRAATPQRRTAMQTGTAGQNAMGSNNQSIRSVASVDIDVAVSASRERLPTAKTLESSLNRIHGIQGGQVTFRSSPTGMTAVLTGTVASERERRVAQQLLLMEPGIDQVENLLEIR